MPPAPETTTSPSVISLRELAAAAIVALEEQERERADAAAARRREELAAVIDRAARYATQVLGDAAGGAQWVALDERNAQAEIGRERFRFRAAPHGASHDLWHVIPCPRCGHASHAEVWHLGRLGLLLRDQPADEYFCEGCAAEATARCEADRQARLQADQAALDLLPPVPDHQVTLRTAVKLANRARTDFETGAYTSASSAAAVSQALTALAREIREGE